MEEQLQEILEFFVSNGQRNVLYLFVLVLLIAFLYSSSKITSYTDIFKEVQKSSEENFILRKYFNYYTILHNTEEISSLLNEDHPVATPWMIKGTKWMNKRKLMTPVFNITSIKHQISVFNRHSQLLVNALNGKSDKINSYESLLDTIGDILIETALGTTTSNSTVKKIIQELYNIKKRQYRSLFMKNRRREAKITNTLHNLIHIAISGITQEQIIEAKPKHTYFEKSSGNLIFEKQKRDKKLQSSSLIEFLTKAKLNGVVITNEEIVELATSYLLSGHGPLTSAACFFLETMAANQDFQKQVQKELDQIFGKSSRSITFGDTLEMKTLERCLLEVLRLNPPIPFIARNHNGPILIPILKLNRRKGEEFNPNLQSAEQCFTFGAGIRACPGKKFALTTLKILLANILRDYEVRCDDKDVISLEADFIMRKVGGFSITFENRKKLQR